MTGNDTLLARWIYTTAFHVGRRWGLVCHVHNQEPTTPLYGDQARRDTVPGARDARDRAPDVLQPLA